MVEATRVELQDFNPLPRKEGDFDLRCNSVCRCHISIHSLVKRETATMSVHCANASYFNPLPRKEGDQLPFQNQCSYPAYFNPLPRKEGDLFSLVCRTLIRGHFNPLPRKEGDGFPFSKPAKYNVISIHSLVKRETEYCLSMQ